LREGIVARALQAHIETGPERHGSRPREILLEPREQLAEGALAAEQQRMHVPRLRRPRAIGGLRGQGVALQHNHPIEVVGERACGREPPIPAPITTACLRSELTPSSPPCRVLLPQQRCRRSPDIATRRRKEAAKFSRAGASWTLQAFCLAEAVIGNAALWSCALHGAVTSFLLLRYCRRGANRLGIPIFERERRFSMTFDIS